MESNLVLKSPCPYNISTTLPVGVMDDIQSTISILPDGLHLIDGRRDFTFSKKSFQIRNRHITDTNSFTFPLFNKFFHGTPGIDVTPLFLIEYMSIAVGEEWETLFCRR
jgi:hypothetical protein